MYKGIKIFLIIFAALACAGYAALCISALFYDAPLGICEDEVFAEIKLLADGKGIYQSYDDGYVSLIYNPLYYYVALPAFFLKASLTSIRVVSILSIIAAFLAVFKILRLLKVDWFMILITFGLLACVSPNTGGAWQQVKADGMMVALVLWGLYFLLKPRWSSKDAIISGVFFTLAFYTKQTALPFVVMAFISVVFIKKRNMYPFIACFFTIFMAIGLALYIKYGYWYLFYTYMVPSRQTLQLAGIREDVLSILVLKLPVIILFAIAGLYALSRMQGREQGYILNAMLIGSFAAYVLPRLKYGGSIFNFLPFGILCCLIFGAMLSKLQEWDGKRANASGSGSSRVGILLIPIFIQFCLAAYNPIAMMPDNGNYRMRDAVVEAVADLDGNVYMPVQSYYAYLGGKEVYSSFIAITDTLNSGLRTSYPKDLLEKLEGGEIKYVLSPKLNKPMSALEGKLPSGITERLEDRGQIVEPDAWPYNKDILYYPTQLFEIVPLGEASEVRE